MSETEPPDAPVTASRSAGVGKADVDTTRDAEFTAFYQANIKPLVAFLLQQGATLADATEISQDTLTQAYRGWRGINHPRAWAHRVASRALIRRLLTNRDTPVEQLPEPNPLLRTTDVEQWEQRHDLLRALAELPPRQRQIMAWALADYTPTEIADELNMTSGAVRQNMHLARRALITLLARKDDDQ